MEVIEGLILKSVPYGERQSIVSLFTKQEGFMSMITSSNIERRRGVLPFMQRCEMEFLRNERGGLHKLRSVAAVDKASTANFNVEVCNYSMLWGNVLASLLREQGADKDMYDYICRAVELLNEYQGRYINLSILFLLRLSWFLGVKPNLDSYKKGMKFNIETGEFVAASAVGGVCTGPNVAEVIYRFSVMDLEKMETLKIDFNSFKIIVDTIILYYERHFNVNFDKTGMRIIMEILGG